MPKKHLVVMGFGREADLLWDDYSDAILSMVADGIRWNSMKPEQRFLFALTLTLGILLVWTALFPPPTPPKENIQPIENINFKSNNEVQEPLFETTNGSFRLGIGIVRGGVQTLQVDGTNLLTASNPGLFQIEQAEPNAASLQFQSRIENGILLSEAELNSSGAQLTRQILIPENIHNYLIECKLYLLNKSKKNQKIQLRLVAYRPLYLPSPSELRYQESQISIQGKTRHFRPRSNQTKDFSGSPSWITAQGKSHTLIFQLQEPAGMFHVEHPLDGLPVGWLTLPQVELTPGQQMEWDFKLYAGPLSLESLKKAGLDEAISFGAFSGVAKFLFGFLRWNQGWLKNYGLAIIFIGFLIWLIFFPITWSGIRMTRMMGKLQPQIEKLRKEYGKDAQRMNREMLQLYQKHKVNPLSGCLPLFFQMPIFIALFQVLNRSPELRGATFLWIKDLSAPDALLRFPTAIPLLGNSLNILPMLMAVGMFFQQRLSQPAQVAVTEEQEVQQKIFRWLPLLFGFIFYSLPSGLVLYWVTNTTLTLGQYLFYFRTHRE